MKGVKIEFKYEFAEGLIQIIDELAGYGYVEDDDKLVIACLLEIKQRLQVRMLTSKKKYTITLSPAQSLALRLLQTDFVDEKPASYMGSKLLQISNEVEQKYK